MKNIFHRIRGWLSGRSPEKDMTSINILQKIQPNTSPQKMAKNISQHFHAKEERKARLLKTVQGNIVKRREEKQKIQTSTPELPIPQLSITVLSHPSAILKIGVTDEPSGESLTEVSLSQLGKPSSEPPLPPLNIQQMDEEDKD